MATNIELRIRVKQGRPSIDRLRGLIYYDDEGLAWGQAIFETRSGDEIRWTELPTYMEELDVKEDTTVRTVPSLDDS